MVSWRRISNKNSISLPTLANTWTLLNRSLPGSLKRNWMGWSCFLPSGHVPLQWLFGPTDVHLRTFVTACLCQSYSSSGWTSLCPQKKTQVKPFLNGKLIFLLCPSSVKQLKLWSGGLGRLVAALKSEVSHWITLSIIFAILLQQRELSIKLIFQHLEEPLLKKQKLVSPEPAALCVAVTGDCVAVGYHGDGIKLFSFDTGLAIC